MAATLPTTTDCPNYALFKTAESLLLALATDTVSASIKLSHNCSHNGSRGRKRWPITMGAARVAHHYRRFCVGARYHERFIEMRVGCHWNLLRCHCLRYCQQLSAELCLGKPDSPWP